MTQDTWLWGFFLLLLGCGLSLNSIAGRLKDINETLREDHER